MGTAGAGIAINNNNFDSTGGINHYGGDTVDGSLNFWNCEEGPGEAGCTDTGGPSPEKVDFSPWLCTAYPNPDGVTNDVLGAACVPPPPLCEAVIESVSIGDAGLQAIDQAYCAIAADGGALFYDDPDSDVDNHGDYVSCVVFEAKLNGFRGNSNPRSGAITKAAAQSSVNK